MTGTVGEGELRLDIYEDNQDRLNEPLQLSLLEKREELLALKATLDQLNDERIVPFNARQRHAYTTQARTLHEFYDLLRKTLAAATVLDGTEYSLRFMQQYPPVNAELPAISIKLLDRRPWSNNGRAEFAPRLMEEVPDPRNPGNMLRIYQRRQTNEIELTCWAKTSKVADELSLWLEDKIYEYMWVLQWCGISHPVTWLGRDRDQCLKDRDQEVFGAPVRIRIITGKLTYENVTILRKVAATIGVSSGL